jgi:multidrug transporter EmrE-like cation transporter
MKHPARYIHKLQVTAHNTSTVRPSYLGNYEKAAGYERRQQSTAFDTWSALKAKFLPHTLWFVILVYALYYLTLLFLHRKEHSLAARRTYEVFGAIGLIGAVAFLVPLLGDGEADMEKHLFLFSACFDLMLAISTTWVTYQIVRIISRRVS